jgi:hypothetical protein
MTARRDGTEPQVAHGAVFLRAAERSHIPLLDDWRGAQATARGLEGA